MSERGRKRERDDCNMANISIQLSDQDRVCVGGLHFYTMKILSSPKLSRHPCVTIGIVFSFSDKIEKLSFHTRNVSATILLFKWKFVAVVGG